MEVKQSITTDISQYLSADIAFKPANMPVIQESDSILARAHEKGLSLQQYVGLFPEEAVRQAEATLLEWLRMQQTAAIEGCIHTSEGTYTINKNTTKLLQTRVEAAQKQLDMVNEYAYTAYNDGEKRREHLLRVLYKRATEKGDTKALLYLIDRVEGRPGEAKTIALDYDNAYNVYQIVHGMFDKQLQVLNSGPGTKMICCSRRAGKTRLFAGAALIECLRQPRTMCLYIGETMELTEDLVNTAMQEIIDEGGLKNAKGQRLDWRHLDNGSKVFIRGLSNTKDPDQIRGFKAKVIIVDEFFHLKSELLEYLVQEVLEPMQMDYATEYKFICGGTPPRVKGTFGEYAWKNWDVPHFTWTYKENPFPLNEDKEAYVDKKLKEKGLTADSTYARREYGAEWVTEEDLLLYPEIHCYNPREGIPQFNITQVLFGIDYGVGDNDTIIGIAWDGEGKRGYEFFSMKFNRLDIKDRNMSQLEFLRGEIKNVWAEAMLFFPTLPPKEANKRILWDADDNNQHLTDDFNCYLRLDEYPDLRLNIMNAHKTDKRAMFDKIRDLLRTANLLLIEGGKTADECERTILKRGPGGQIYEEVDDRAYHPDLLPAMRYALYNVIGREG